MPKWTCSVTIVNETDGTLELISSELPWGKKDGIFPERIGPGESGKFSVYTPNAISSGIEMSFTMRDVAPGSDRSSYGMITFSVDIPYWKHENSSSFKCTGSLRAEGFVPVSDGAHNYSTTVQIFTV